MSRLLSDRYLTLSTVWTPHGWRLNVEMFMGECRSFQGTHWTQRKLPEPQSLCVSILEECLSLGCQGASWLSWGEQSSCNDHRFEESYPGDIVLCPFSAQVPDCHFSSVPFPLPPVKSYSCFFLAENPTAIRLVCFGNTMQSFHSFLPACLLGVVFKSGHDPLSRTDR